MSSLSVSESLYLTFGKKFLPGGKKGRRKEISHFRTKHGHLWLCLTLRLSSLQFWLIIYLLFVLRMSTSSVLPEFTVLSYNVLADQYAVNPWTPDLYGYVPSQYLDWNYRKHEIRKIILRYWVSVIYPLWLIKKRVCYVYVYVCACVRCVRVREGQSWCMICVVLYIVVLKLISYVFKRLIYSPSQKKSNTSSNQVCVCPALATILLFSLYLSLSLSIYIYIYMKNNSLNPLKNTCLPYNFAYNLI